MIGTAENTVEPQNLVADEALAYCAGYFDAEGCIQIMRGKNRNGKCYFGMLISFTNSDIRSLNFILSILNSGHIRLCRKGTLKRKQMFRLQLNSEDANIALLAMLPYLICKRERALIAIKFQELCSQKKFSIKDREQFKAKISSLNDGTVKQKSAALKVLQGEDSKVYEIDESLIPLPKLLANDEMSVYLAGYVDGEGCIRIWRDREHRRFLLRFTIASGDLKPIQAISSMVGGKISLINKTNLKTIYRLDLRSSKAVDVIYSLLPFLIIKREQAEFGLEFYNRYTIGSLSAEECEKYFVLLALLKNRPIAESTKEERTERIKLLEEENRKTNNKIKQIQELKMTEPQSMAI